VLIGACQSPDALRVRRTCIQTRRVMVFKKRVRERKRCSMSLYMRTPYKSHSSTCDEPDTDLCIHKCGGCIHKLVFRVYAKVSSVDTGIWCTPRWVTPTGVSHGGGSRVSPAPCCRHQGHGGDASRIAATHTCQWSNVAGRVGPSCCWSPPR